MTVIAAAVDRGRVRLAADSGCSGDDGLVTPMRKLVEVGDGVWLGVAGKAASLGIVVAHVRFTVKGTVDASAQRFAEAWSKILTDTGLEKAGEQETVGILARGGRCWDLSERLAIPVTDFHAIGSGGPVAAGAMWMANTIDTPRSELPRLGVQAALARCHGISGDIFTATT